MRLFKSDSGVTLTELAVASFVAAVVTAGAITWAVAVNNVDQRNEEALKIVDELRWAKTELVSELRFAEDIFPPASGDKDISLYVESNGTDGMQAGVGELVTYTILSDGRLERSTDDPGADARIFTRHLIYADSSITINGTNTVTLEFVADADLGDSVDARTIRTTVKVRKKA